ncbi:MAG: MGH1-like glycoside hydrolase domain-containing protein [Bacteroidota bacterium]
MLYVDGLPANPQETIFEPHKQSTAFSKDGVVLRKEIVLPISDSNECSASLESFYQRITIQNQSAEDRKFRIEVEIIFHGVDSPFFPKKVDRKEACRTFKVTEEGYRIVASDLEDGARAFVYYNLRPTNLRLTDRGAFMVFEADIAPSLESSLVIVAGRQSSETFSTDFDQVEQSAKSVYDRYLGIAEILTPNDTINRGIYWAKVNILRVWHHYFLGDAFTNDPPQDIVVVRDVTWFVFGCDYFLPSLSRSLLDFARKYCVHKDGKLTEYVHAAQPTPELHDYNLNVNDNTPLFILAVEHHLNTTDDSTFLESFYPIVVKAANYILTQIRQGLVYADSNGVGVWGIAGWRNIIESYNLSGFVTEINSECFAAFKAAARIARKVDDLPMAERYETAAEKLRAKMLSELRDEQTGLFYLNVDKHGRAHADVTGDMVFPALFEVTDDEDKRTLIDRLLRPDIWTEAGARTVSKSDPTYHPEDGKQLLGGIWHNLTAWIAMAAKEYHENVVAETLYKIWKYCEADEPSKFRNLVPGEFPERLNGDTFESSGMSLSPWMPPTYLWLAVEGLLGLKAQDGSLRIEPSIPKGWDFLCAFNVPIHGSFANFLIYDGVVYTNVEIVSNLKVRIGQFQELQDDRHERIWSFQDSNGIFVFSISSASSDAEFSEKRSFIFDEFSKCRITKLYDSSKA